jgi:hypothetical protein
MFGVICPGVLFVISVPVPPELEKYFIDVSRPRRIEMHYVTRRSHWMQKRKFVVTCPIVFLWKPQWTHPRMKNSALTFMP